MRYLTIILIFTITNLFGQALWYEDSNVGVAAGTPSDFKQMFTDPCEWNKIRGKMDTYVIRGISLDKILREGGTDFVRDTMAKFLAANDIKVMIDNPPTNFLPMYTLLTSAGVNITHVAIQSELSRPINGVSPQYQPELDVRIFRVRDRILEYKKFATDVKFGIIDARPTKGWHWKIPYRRMQNVMLSANSKLDFIILDCPYGFALRENDIEYLDLQEIEDYVKNFLKIEYGFIITDNIGGKQSELAFKNGVLNYAKFCQNRGLDPDYYILMSWYPLPKTALPERRPLPGQFPLTNVGLDLFNLLDQ